MRVGIHPSHIDVAVRDKASSAMHLLCTLHTPSDAMDTQSTLLFAMR
jgi:hypothetical protein